MLWEELKPQKKETGWKWSFCLFLSRYVIYRETSAKMIQNKMLSKKNCEYQVQEYTL
jgi:hypothetical protein